MMQKLKAFIDGFFRVIDVLAGVKSQLIGFGLSVYDLLVIFGVTDVTNEQLIKINAAGAALWTLTMALKVQRQKASA